MPAGTEVEITLSIDESRKVKLRAFVPLLDEEFEAEFDHEEEVLNIDTLCPRTRRPGGAPEEAARRLKPVARGSRRAPDDRGRGHGRPGAHDAHRHARRSEPRAGIPQAVSSELKIALDRAEDARSGRGSCASPRRRSTGRERSWTPIQTSAAGLALQTLREDVRAAQQAHDVDLLRARTNEVRTLTNITLRESPAVLVGWLGEFEEMNKQNKLTDRAAAERLIAQGRRAAQNNDVEALRSAVNQLIALMPGGRAWPAQPSATCSEKEEEQPCRPLRSRR